MTFQNTKGFTLVEILIVATLMGLLIAFTVPQFLTFNRRSLTREQARLVLNGIQTAQNLAETGVQDVSSTVDRYRFRLLPGRNDPTGCYRGYEIVGVKADGTKIPPNLETKAVSCPVVIESDWDELYYQTITGTVQGFAPGRREQTFKACYPGLGYLVVTVDIAGTVTAGEFVDESGGCSCTAVCSDIVPSLD